MKGNVIIKSIFCNIRDFFSSDFRNSLILGASFSLFVKSSSVKSSSSLSNNGKLAKNRNTFITPSVQNILENKT